jgi:hypothetical protein
MLSDNRHDRLGLSVALVLGDLEEMSDIEDLDI